MTIRVRLGRLVAVAAVAAGTLATVGSAHADDCHTSVTCGYSADAGTYEPGSAESCTDIKCVTIQGITIPLKESDLKGSGLLDVSGMPPNGS